MATTGSCRLLIGMAERPEDELRKLFSLRGGQEIDQSTVVRLKQRMAQEFRQQLVMGAPTNQDQEGLRRLSAQLKAKRVVVKLFLRHKLHAKLYLLYQTEPHHPHRRLSRQQQPHSGRTPAPGRTERRCAGQRCLYETGAVVQ